MAKAGSQMGVERKRTTLEKGCMNPTDDGGKARRSRPAGLTHLMESRMQ